MVGSWNTNKVMVVDSFFFCATSLDLRLLHDPGRKNRVEASEATGDITMNQKNG